MNLEEASLLLPCIGFLSKALERGFASSVPNPGNDPIYALTFMTNILLNYATGSTVPTTQLPYWLLCLGHAISPKDVVYKTGRVSYSFNYVGANPLVVNTTMVLGYPSNGYQWTCGPNDYSTTVNNFPTVIMNTPAYTPALGEVAFQALCQFMISNTSNPAMQKTTRMVASTTSTPFLRDVSAFAVSQMPTGLGASGVGGGVIQQAQLEVPIFHPLLTLFGSAGEPGGSQFPNRFYSWAIPTAGDALFLGAAMCDMYTTNELFAKRRPRFHSVDFLQLGDVLARWVQKVIQRFMTDTKGQYTIAQLSDFLCPISLQEVLFLLRAVCMGAFKETQSAVQALYPFKPITTPGDNQFVPYISSSGTCALSTPDMHLPIPFIENIRALVGKKLQIKGSDVVWYVPTLGQFVLDALDPMDYLVFADASDGFFSSSAFTTGPHWKRKVTSAKGEVSYKLGVDVPVSLIDGSSGSSLVAINDPDHLKVLTALWSGWVTGTGVQSFSAPCGTFGTEKGITALSSVTMTRHIVTAIAGRRVTDRDELDLRMVQTKNKALVSTPYATKWAIADTSQGVILASVYEQVLGVWVLPVTLTEDSSPTESTKLQRWQFVMEEPFMNNLSSGSNGMSLSFMNDTYATKMTKAKLAAQDDWSAFFAEQARLGRGGILSSIVGGFLSSAFPAAAPIIKGVASMVPF